MKILYVEDDPEAREFVQKALAQHGCVVDLAENGAEGLERATEAAYDILVLDVMLPGQDGFAVCRKLRETSPLPIVMLTARGSVMDRIVGLEMGADDYLPKPFEPRELVARIQAVLRRGAGAPPGERVQVGSLEVDWGARSARLGGRPLDLTTAEFELLGLLVRNRGRVLTRERILDQTRGVDWEAYDRSVDVLVSRLRGKLGDDARRPAFIKTVRGVGYSFVAGGDD